MTQHCSRWTSLIVRLLTLPRQDRAMWDRSEGHGFGAAGGLARGRCTRRQTGTRPSRWKGAQDLPGLDPRIAEHRVLISHSSKVRIMSLRPDGKHWLQRHGHVLTRYPFTARSVTPLRGAQNLALRGVFRPPVGNFGFRFMASRRARNSRSISCCPIITRKGLQIPGQGVDAKMGKIKKELPCAEQS